MNELSRMSEEEYLYYENQGEELKGIESAEELEKKYRKEFGIKEEIK